MDAMSYQEMKPVEFDFNQIRAHSTIGSDRASHTKNKFYVQKSRIQKITGMPKIIDNRSPPKISKPINNPIISNTFEI